MKFITLSGKRFNVDFIVKYETIKNPEAKKCWASYVYTVDKNKTLVDETVEEIDEIIQWELKN